MSQEKWFKEQEKAELGSSTDLNTVLDNIKFNADGLAPAIAQQHDTGEVLMLAWMNRRAIEETLQTGHITYWSRSRQTYWRKGEMSGNRQRLKSMRFDCDGDAILLQVEQTGPACHTNRRDCFYHEVQNDKVVIVSAPKA